MAGTAGSLPNLLQRERRGGLPRDLHHRHDRHHSRGEGGQQEGGSAVGQSPLFGLMPNPLLT